MPAHQFSRNGRKYKRQSVTETPFQLKGQDWLRMTPSQKNYYAELAFKYWRHRGFPHYKLSIDDIQSEFLQVCYFDWRRVFCGNTIRGSSVGLRLANFFHPSMWRVRVSRYRSPHDVFTDDALLRSAIRKAFLLWPSRYSANASCLRRILKTLSNTASVSNFKPTVAKAVIARYSMERELVIDCCAGYGGRLLGCLALRRRFLGIEPCTRQVIGLRRSIQLIARLGLTNCIAEIRNGCAEDVMKEFPSGTAALVFSSPPYFDWERYAKDRTQSSVRYSSYPEWREHFLATVIRQSARVLRKQGHLILNISNGARRPSCRDVTQIARSYGLVLRKSYLLLIPKVPYLHPHNNNSHKCEKLIVFRKV